MAPPRLSFRNARGRLAEEIAQAGGSWVGPTWYAGHPQPDYHTELRDTLWRAQRIATSADAPHPRQLVRMRLELVAGWAGRPAGFRDAWIALKPARQWWGELREWVQAGYHADLHPSFDSAWFWEVAGTGEQMPAVYAQVNPERKLLHVHRLLCDLRSAEYRRWAVAMALDGLAWARSPYALVGIKTGMMWAPQRLRYTPRGVVDPRTGGEVLFPSRPEGGIFTTAILLGDTPYAPGVCEAAYEEMLVALADAGAIVVSNVNPPPGEMLWSALSTATREAIAAEA